MPTSTEWDLIEQLLGSSGLLQGGNAKKTYGFDSVFPNLQNFGTAQSQTDPYPELGQNVANTQLEKTPPKEDRWGKFSQWMDEYGPALLLGISAFAKEPDVLATASGAWQQAKTQREQQAKAEALAARQQAEEQRRWDALYGLKLEDMARLKYQDKAKENRENAAIQASREQTRAAQEEAEAEQERAVQRWQLIQDVVANADPSERNNLTRLQTSALGMDDPDVFFKGYATPPKEEKKTNQKETTPAWIKELNDDYNDYIKVTPADERLGKTQWMAEHPSYKNRVREYLHHTSGGEDKYLDKSRTTYGLLNPSVTSSSKLLRADKYLQAVQTGSVRKAITKAINDREDREIIEGLVERWNMTPGNKKRDLNYWVKQAKAGSGS